MVFDLLFFKQKKFDVLNLKIITINPMFKLKKGFLDITQTNLLKAIIIKIKRKAKIVLDISINNNAG